MTVSQSIAGKWRLYAKELDSPQNTLTMRSVACETGSEISPPGGETAPMAEMLNRGDHPRQGTTTAPARS